MKKPISFALIGAIILFSGCAHRQISTASGLGPSLVVEQFMRAANARDLDGMARLFGTKAGPASEKWGRTELEQRMFAIATELHHNDYEVAGEAMVPGRTETATKVNIRLTNENGKYIVPFTLVRYKSDSWLIEQIGIEVLTAPKH